MMPNANIQRLGLVILAVSLVGTPSWAEEVTTQPDPASQPATKVDANTPRAKTRPKARDPKTARPAKRLPGLIQGVRPRRPFPEFSAKVEADVLAFLEKHHPELANVLRTLKTMQPKTFERAICELEKTRLLLSRLQKKSDVRYENELEIWKVSSRIELLLARYQNHPEINDVKTLLRPLVERQWELTLQRKQLERDRLKRALESNTKQIKQLQDDKDALISNWTDKTLRALRNNKRKSSSKRTTESE